MDADLEPGQVRAQAQVGPAGGGRGGETEGGAACPRGAAAGQDERAGPLVGAAGGLERG